MLYYDSNSSPHKKTVAYAKSMVSHVLTFDFSDTPSTGLSWRQILISMNKHPKELLNKALPEYQNHIRGREFTMEGWLKILQYKTHLFKRLAIKRDSNKAMKLGKKQTSMPK